SARRAPAAREPGERRDEKERAERCGAGRGASAEGLRDPAIGRDDLVDRAADADHHERDDDESEEDLRQRMDLVLDLGGAHCLLLRMLYDAPGRDAKKYCKPHASVAVFLTA